MNINEAISQMNLLIYHWEDYPVEVNAIQLKNMHICKLDIEAMKTLIEAAENYEVLSGILNMCVESKNMKLSEAISWLEDIAEDLEDEIDEGYDTESNVCRFEALQMAIRLMKWLSSTKGEREG